MSQQVFDAAQQKNAHPLVVVLDNHDSFVHTLARYMRLAAPGARVEVVRSDAVAVADLAAWGPAALVLSPGPGRPEGAGVCVEAVRALRIPMLGVCLGHQCIATAFGGRVGRAQVPMHGRAAAVTHAGGALFAGVPSPFLAGRYHSLIVEDMPPGLAATAWSEQGEIMALRHTTRPVWGVQIHPESLLTPDGMRIIHNFISLSGVLRLAG